MGITLDHTAVALFTDGGVVKKNPSALGGTWAWVAVDARDQVVGRDSGLVVPGPPWPPLITNNLTELLAAVHALEALPDGWAGLFHTDSLVTLRRVTDSNSFAGIPPELADRCRAVRRRLGPFRRILLNGHPTQVELLTGFGKRGLPTSKWNVHCDKECGRLAAAFLEGLERGPPATDAPPA